ncbi:MAG: hypothetical protein OXG15_07125 [Gammaproteobacteria bacterium]|nr:hypothetical protein [Gammaproteobacteria bacterium]
MQTHTIRTATQVLLYAVEAAPKPHYRFIGSLMHRYGQYQMRVVDNGRIRDYGYCHSEEDAIEILRVLNTPVE